MRRVIIYFIIEKIRNKIQYTLLFSKKKLATASYESMAEQ